MSKAFLSIKNLSCTAKDTPILKGLNLDIEQGSIHAIMGPNGSGKSTLAHTLMGHPLYEAAGSILFDGEELLELSPDKRAKKGLFLAFQYPFEIEGLAYIDFLRQAYNALHGGSEKQLGIKAFREHVSKQMERLGIKEDFLSRHLNVGFSGGEKKRAEILQLATLMPKVAILDEIDSGLDIDALKAVCAALSKIKEENPSMTIIFITHYQRILNYIKPDFVHIMDQGVIKKSGDFSLAQKLEAEGYSL
jgi:Fe-S cluster assembly ATP-binding protein